MKSSSKKGGADNASRGADSARPEQAAADTAGVEHIATAAYFKAQARGFSPGREIDDWLEAESEYRQALDGQATRP